MSNAENASPSTTIGVPLGAALTILAVIAAASMGFLIGFITGASDSPVGNVAISAVGGLLAGLGVHSALQGSFKVTLDALKAMLIAVMIFVFCWATFAGIFFGGKTRTAVVYGDIINLVGDRWRYSGPEIVTDVRAFRARAHFAGLPRADYEDFMLEVVYPIINDDKPQKAERLRSALATMEAAFPKPEPKADENPKPGPAPEPAGADSE